MRILFFYIFFCTYFLKSVGQDSSNIVTPSISKQKIRLASTINLTAYSSTIILLNNTWYKNYPKSKFHNFNDSKEWLQVDKIGHAWTAYNIGKAQTELWKSTGISDKKATIIGGLSGSGFLTAIEILDAHSQNWGWSWADMGANFLGSEFFVVQEIAWHEQRIQFKFSFHSKKYKEDILQVRANNLFGNSFSEKMLKDYNTQTYWLSFNMRSFFKESKFPGWLNFAIGYGADGMLGGFENKWKDKFGNEIIRMDILRRRQFYFAPDIDFTKIKTRNKFLKTSFIILNAFKFPSPTIRFEKWSKIKFYPFYF